MQQPPGNVPFASECASMARQPCTISSCSEGQPGRGAMHAGMHVGSAQCHRLVRHLAGRALRPAALPSVHPAARGPALLWLPSVRRARHVRLIAGTVPFVQPASQTSCACPGSMRARRSTGHRHSLQPAIVNARGLQQMMLSFSSTTILCLQEARMSKQTMQLSGCAAHIELLSSLKTKMT